MIFQVSPWVSTRTYKVKEIISISYISDEMNAVCYVLKGLVSELWEKLVEVQNYNVLYDYALKNNLEDEFKNLLSELKIKNLIQTDMCFVKPDKEFCLNEFSKKKKNYIYFKRIENNFIAQQGFIPELYFILNYQCNLKCRHCFVEQDKSNEKISFNSAKSIIDEMYNWGLSSVYLTGGECTINDDFLEIVRYIRKKYLKLYIFTNAQKLYDDRNFLDEIISVYPASVYISLYSMNEDVHDFITQKKGSYYKTLKVIEYLRKNGISVGVSCLQMKYNVGEYQKVKEYALSIGAEYLTGTKFIYNSDASNCDAKIDKVEIEKYFIENIHTFNERGDFIKGNQRVCSAGLKKICIAPNLDVLPCVYFDYVLCNYRDTSATKLKNEILPRFKEYFVTKNLDECFKYDYCKYCVYCPKYCKKFMGKSDVLCEAAKAYKNATEYHNLS